MPQGFVKAAQAGELAPGQKKLVYLSGQRVLLVNVEGGYYAVAEVCPHAHAVLSKGQLYGEEMVCPLHGSAFNVKTGAVLCPPAIEGLAVYSVRTEGEDILVGPPGA
jgi:3-phenylpropionate/trans-cinnamate dioxygenase ferredoxin subunit